MGGGTTAVACKELKRDFIGFDINEEYVNIATKRLDDALHENQEISNDYIPKITKEEERRKLKRLIKRKKRLIKY